jgi:integrase
MEAKTEADCDVRERSDFLAYCNHVGRYADFHSCRHLFITSLERAGVRPKVAQTLARHSDIRLTLGIYTHTELTEQTAAIAALPGLPRGSSI